MLRHSMFASLMLLPVALAFIGRLLGMLHRLSIPSLTLAKTSVLYLPPRHSALLAKRCQLTEPLKRALETMGEWEK
jgi:hypothetical protein